MKKKISKENIKLISLSLMALQFMKHYNYKEISYENPNHRPQRGIIPIK